MIFYKVNIYWEDGDGIKSTFYFREKNNAIAYGEEWIKKFAKEESKVYKNISGQLAQSTFGIFGDKDELFSYKSTFKKKYDNLNKENTILVEGNHSLSNASLQKGFSAAIKYLNEYLV